MSAACHRWGVVERRYSNHTHGWASKVLSRHKTQIAAKAHMDARAFPGLLCSISVRRLTKSERGLS